MSDGPHIEFDEATHTYKVDGVIIPSVTTIIGGLPDFLAFNPAVRRAALRGTAVHAICERINNGEEIDPDSHPDITDEMRGYVEAYYNWLEHSDCAIHGSEIRVFSQRHQYTGTLDILAEDERGRLGVADIKCVVKLTPQTALQTAAYANGYEEMNPDYKIEWRKAIQLKPDGNFTVKEYGPHRADFRIFLAKLTSWQWDKANGIKGDY